MIHIFRKEILRTMISGEFAVSLSGAVILFAVCSYFFISGYRETPVRQVRPSTRSIILEKPASPLGFCIRDPGANVRLRPGFVGPITAGNPERSSGLHTHITLDWVFVIVVAFGIIGIVLSFSAINGEKEDGTLRQILSNSVPRSSVFLGKYLALTTATVLPLLAGSLVGLLVVETFGPTGMIWAHIAHLGVFFSLRLHLCFGCCAALPLCVFHHLQAFPRCPGIADCLGDMDLSHSWQLTPTGFKGLPHALGSRTG